MIQLSFSLMEQSTFYNAFIIQELNNRMHTICTTNSTRYNHYPSCSVCKPYYAKILYLSSSNSSRVKNDFYHKATSFSRTK